MQQSLKDTVPRNFSTGYIFADINNDLGDWSKTAQSHPRLAQMVYAYARRVAVQALYAQGLVDLSKRTGIPSCAARPVAIDAAITPQSHSPAASAGE